MMSSGKIGNFVRTLYSLRSYAKKHAEERAEAEGRDAPGALLSPEILGSIQGWTRSRLQ